MGTRSCRLGLLRRLDIARKYWLRRRQQYPAPQPSSLVETGKRAFLCRNAKQVEKLSSGYRHIRLNENADLTQDFSGHIEHRIHAQRVALAQGPRLLSGEIAVGVGDNLPDRIKGAVDGLHLMMRPALRK